MMEKAERLYKAATKREVYRILVEEFGDLPADEHVIKQKLKRFKQYLAVYEKKYSQALERC